MNINYDKLMQEEIETFGDRKPKLLLHSCCGPCSTAVLERIMPYFDITVLYYNPNAMTLTLVTCTKDNDSLQTVYVAEYVG